MNNQLFDIYIINLERSLDRMNHIKDYLEKRGYDYIRVEGVDGKKYDTKHDMFVDNNYPNYKLDLNLRNEVGCYLSHMKCLNKFLKESKRNWALILEDDADFVKEIDQINNLIQNNKEAFEKGEFYWLNQLGPIPVFFLFTTIFVFLIGLTICLVLKKPMYILLVTVISIIAGLIVYFATLNYLPYGDQPFCGAHAYLLNKPAVHHIEQFINPESDWITSNERKKMETLHHSDAYDIVLTSTIRYLYNNDKLNYHWRPFATQKVGVNSTIDDGYNSPIGLLPSGRFSKKEKYTSWF